MTKPKPENTSRSWVDFIRRYQGSAPGRYSTISYSKRNRLPTKFRYILLPGEGLAPVRVPAGTPLGFKGTHYKARPQDLETLPPTLRVLLTGSVYESPAVAPNTDTLPRPMHCGRRQLSDSTKSQPWILRPEYISSRADGSRRLVVLVQVAHNQRGCTILCRACSTCF